MSTINSTNDNTGVSGRSSLKTPNAEVSAFYRFNVGDHELTVINDGVSGFPASVLALNAPEGELLALLTQNRMVPDFVPLQLGTVMVRAGERLVLIETGDGMSGFAGENTGKLSNTLALLGVQPEDITDVILTHYHPDHVGGVSFNGKLAYPNAQYYLPQLEWDFLQRDDVGEFLAPFVAFARTKLQPAAKHDGQLIFYGDEDELVPGVQAVAALGHSIGQHALIIESSGQRILFTADAITHPVLSLRMPDWFGGVDQFPDMTVETRHKLLARIVAEQIPVLGYHFPFPGIGNIVQDGSAYRFLPTG